MRIFPVTMAAVAALGYLLSAPADAAVAYKHQSQNPATACTLSIPTTDTKVRPKAIGFRNEGTGNAFMVCGFDKESPAASWPYQGFVKLEVKFAAFDGGSHSFDCTGVSRDPSMPSGIYLPKQVTVDEFGGQVEFNIYDVIFNNYNLDTRSQAITCLLPPGVAVIAVESDYADVDGTPMACANGKDDDNDGLTDSSDPGCSDSRGINSDDNNEADDDPMLSACSDGIDNDGDGRTDYMDDPHCTDSTDPNEMYFGS